MSAESKKPHNLLSAAGDLPRSPKACMLTPDSAGSSPGLKAWEAAVPRRDLYLSLQGQAKSKSSLPCLWVLFCPPIPPIPYANASLSQKHLHRYRGKDTSEQLIHKVQLPG